MCVSKPKVPKIEPIPDRRASVLPDGGDPTLRQSARKRDRTSAMQAMIFTNQGTLGAPSVAKTSTLGG